MALDATMLANVSDAITAVVGYISTGQDVLTTGVFALGVGFILVKGGIRVGIRVLSALVH